MVIKNISIVFICFFIVIPFSLSYKNLRKLEMNNNDNEIFLITEEGFDFNSFNNKFNELSYENLINNIRVNFEDKEIDLSEFGFTERNLSRRIKNITIKFNKTMTDCSYMFYNLTKVTEIDLSKFDFSDVNNTSKMFAECKDLKSIYFPNNKIVAQIKDMNNMFYNCLSLTSVDLTKLEISLVTNLESMFYNCKSLQYLNLENIDTTNVINISSMFYECNSLLSINLKNFKTNNVSDMSYMFYNCKNLSELNLSNFNTSNIISLNSIFKGCDSLISLDLSNFNFNNVPLFNELFNYLTFLKILNLSNVHVFNENSDLSYLFHNNYNLEILDLSDVKLGNNKKINFMFYNCSKLEILNLTNFQFNDMINNDIFRGLDGLKFLILNKAVINKTDLSFLFYGLNNLISLDLSEIKTNFIENISYMFYNCSKLKNLDLSYFNTSNVRNMLSIFEGCDSMISLDLSNWDFSNINHPINIFNGLKLIQFLSLNNANFYNIANLSYLFYDLNSLISLDLSNINISLVKNIEYIFGNCFQLISLNLTNFNTIDVDNVEGMFYNCHSIKKLNLSDIITDNIKNMQYMFEECNELTSLNLSNFNTENVENMEKMFFNCYKLQSLDLSNFNTSNLQKLKNIFDNCDSLISLNLSKWDFTNVTHILRIFNFLKSLQTLILNDADLNNISDISYLFYNLNSLTYLEYSNLDVSSVTNMEYIFGNCYKLTSFDIIILNSDNIENMRGIFYNCHSLKELNLSDLKTNNVKDMGFMFANCIALISLNLSSFNTKNVENMEKMFYNCSSLKSLDLSFFNTSNVKNMASMINKCNSLLFLDLSNFDCNQLQHPLSFFKDLPSLQILNLSHVNISNITDISYMFYNLQSIISIDFSELDTSNVINMQYLFGNCYKLSSLNLSTLKTYNTKNMEGMFSNCRSLRKLDISSLITNETISLNNMFSNCCNLTYLDLSNFNTHNVIDLGGLFQGCKKLEEFNISNFITSKVTNMGYMFDGCEELTLIDISHLDIKNNVNASFMFRDCIKVKEIKFKTDDILYFSNLCSMFENCKKLTSIDLLNFNTNNVRNMSYMFYNCIKIEKLNLSFFNTQNTNYMYYMFSGCERLQSLDLSNFRISNVSSINSIFYGCNSMTSLDLSNWDFNHISLSKSIFNNLVSLNYLKLSHVKIHTSSMRNLFCNLSYIVSLDLSNFDTTYVTDMYGLFANSKKLKFINLTNFYTYNVQVMWYLFDGCISLTSLDLSSFDTSRVTDFDVIFRNMSSLNYIKLKNFKTSSLVYKYNIFYGTNYFEYCIEDETKMTYFYDLITAINTTIRDCSDKCYNDKRKLNKITNKCIPIDCSNNITHKYEYNFDCYKICPKRTYLYSNESNLCLDLFCDNYYNYNQTECIDEIPEGYYLNDSYIKTIDKCHSDCRDCDIKPNLNNTNCKYCFPDKYLYYGNCIDNCPNGYYIDGKDNTKKICKCPDVRCTKCSKESLELNLCISCNDNYYPIFFYNNDYFNDTYNNSSINQYLNCSQNPEGYYLDLNDYFYKECYNTCKKCDKKGDEINNNCLECNNKYIFKNDFPNDTNCYENCTDYYYYDYQKKYHCVEICPYEFNKFIEEKKRCIENCSKDNTFKYEYKNKCYKQCPPKTKNNNNYICEYFNCTYYYNYNQTECIDEIPEGYYLNDSYIKTIDKCHSDCRDCDIKPNLNNTNCKYCFPDKYLYYGNCIDNCPNGYYTDEKDNTIKICKCINSLCISCPLENTNLCYSCNPPYYQIYNDYNNTYPFVNCYNNPEGYYLDKNDNVYKSCYKSCKTCDGYGNETNNNCIECNINFNKKSESENDKNCYPRCPFYYYFDFNKNYFCTNENKCPDKIFNKKIDEKNICIDSCEKDDKYKYEFKKKCHEKCPLNTKSKNNYFCDIDCPDDFPYEIIETQQCVSNCSFSDISKGICYLNNQNSQKVKEKQNEIARNIQENIINGGVNTSSLDEGKDIVIESIGTSFTVTTTENQKKSQSKNITTIDLGECEFKLKKYYDINVNKSLYIFKVEVLNEGMKVPKIEYEVYYPLFGDNLIKLNLTVCEDEKIGLSIPVKIDENNIDKYDPNSDYYNDKCCITTSEKGTDITLTDRKNEFIDNNLTLCEEDCEFEGYDTKTKKALCSCYVKISFPLISDITIDKNRLLNSFSNFQNIANLDLMICYDKLFTKIGFTNNYGCSILLGSILSLVICIIIFYVKGNDNLKIIIYKIISYKNDIKELKRIKKKYGAEIKREKNKIKDNKKNTDSIMNFNIKKIKIETSEPIEQRKLKKNKRRSQKTSNNLIITNSNEIKDNKTDEENEENIDNLQMKKRNSKKENKTYKNKQKRKAISKIENKSICDDRTIQTMLRILKNKENQINKNKEIMNLNDSELNQLQYKDSLKKDNRTYLQYYCSLIKTKHIIIFTFFTKNDYNSRIIKISIFIFSFSIYFTVNALFFDDSTMHQIYKDSGSFNFIYQIPQILYSALISVFLNVLLKALALTENNILKLKKEHNKNKLAILANKVLKIIFYKVILYFIVSFLILLLCWYYLSCFCCIYKNTQIHLIKDTLISFGLSLFYPFLLYMIPSIFRICAIRAVKKDKKYMYNFSKLIQF